MSDGDDWEKWGDDEAEVKENNQDKFKDEQVYDKEKEEREKKEREVERQARIEESKKKEPVEEKDYEKMYANRFEKKSDNTVKTKEDLLKENPNLTEAQLSELLSRQADDDIAGNLFGGDNTPKEAPVKPKMPFNFDTLKGEKAYKQVGKEIGEFIATKGQSHNFIPQLIGALIAELTDKMTAVKMRSVVSDFENLLKKKEQESVKKPQAVPKKKKKTAVGGVGKALDSNNLIINDVFNEDFDDGEGEYGNEGDGYVDYGRDDIDFI